MEEGYYFTLISGGKLAKGPSQHFLKVTRETGEKLRSRMGAEGLIRNVNEFTIVFIKTKIISLWDIFPIVINCAEMRFENCKL